MAVLIDITVWQTAAKTDLCSMNGETTQRYFCLSEWQHVLLAMRDQMHLQAATFLSP